MSNKHVSSTCSIPTLFSHCLQTHVYKYHGKQSSLAIGNMRSKYVLVDGCAAENFLSDSSRSALFDNDIRISQHLNSLTLLIEPAETDNILCSASYRIDNLDSRDSGEENIAVSFKNNSVSLLRFSELAKAIHVNSFLPRIRTRKKKYDLVL